MLVGYSSSSEEEDETEGAASNDKSKRRPRTCQEEEKDDDDDCAAKKKLKAEEQLPRTRLPIPGCLLDMFPEEAEPQDSSLHGGRIRSFKHERGNWATYVYLSYHSDEEFEGLLEELVSVTGAHGVVLTRQDEFHLSLSQTVVLRHHWIQPFTQSLRAGLAHCKSHDKEHILIDANNLGKFSGEGGIVNNTLFACSAGRLKVYSNAEKTRTFLGMEVSTGHAQLLELVRVVDKTMTEFRLDTFYKDPSFHVSLGWCVGDITEQMEGFLQELQSLVDSHEEGPFPLRLDCQELRCRAGNKTFIFPLEPL